MSEALLTFQSQLSVVMETVLKSAMFEITRLVEGSFLEEAGHRKQEVELLRRRLQLSESTLRQKDWEQSKRIHCPDCGCDRKGDSSDSLSQSQCVETVYDPILKDQSANDPPLTQDVGRISPQLESNTLTIMQPHSEDKHDVRRQIAKEIAAPNSSAQFPHVLQILLGNATVHSESTIDLKPRLRDIEKFEKDFTLDNQMDSNHSSPLTEDGQEKLELSLPKRVKSELDLLPVKEEKEMVPVWESINRDDGCHGELADSSQEELRGSCDQEIKVESFPDGTSYFIPYAVNTLVHQSIQSQQSHLCPSDLVQSSIPESSNGFVQQENGQSCRGPNGSESAAPYSHDVVCPDEEMISHAQYPQHFSQDKQRMPEQAVTERSHHCTRCGRTFAKARDLRVHIQIHKGKKPLSCPQCNQTFAYNFELKLHEQRHSGERPHVCPHCGKAFARLSNYRQHQNIHTQEKVFSCSQCGVRFNRATHLRVHLIRHSHAGKTYNCPQCGKSFLGSGQMKAHLLKIHGRGGK